MLLAGSGLPDVLARRVLAGSYGDNKMGLQSTTYHIMPQSAERRN